MPRSRWPGTGSNSKDHHCEPTSWHTSPRRSCTTYSGVCGAATAGVAEAVVGSVTGTGARYAGRGRAAGPVCHHAAGAVVKATNAHSPAAHATRRCDTVGITRHPIRDLGLRKLAAGQGGKNRSSCPTSLTQWMQPALAGRSEHTALTTGCQNSPTQTRGVRSPTRPIVLSSQVSASSLSVPTAPGSTTKPARQLVQLGDAMGQVGCADDLVEIAIGRRPPDRARHADGPPARLAGPARAGLHQAAVPAADHRVPQPGKQPARRQAQLIQPVAGTGLARAEYRHRPAGSAEGCAASLPPLASAGLARTPLAMLLSPAAGVVQQPAGGQDLPLPRRQAQPADDVDPARHVAHRDLVGRGDGPGHVLDHQLVAGRSGRSRPASANVSGRMREVDQVGLVDPLDGLGDHRPDAQVHRAQGGVLAAGALAVAVAGDDDAGLARLPWRASARSAKVGSPGSLKQLKTYLAYSGTLERCFSSAPAGMMWSVVILSPTLMQHLPGERVAAAARRAGGLTMVEPRTTSTAGRLRRRQRRLDHAVVDRELLGRLDAPGTSMPSPPPGRAGR